MLAAVQPTASGDSGIGPAMRAYRAEVAAFGKASEEVIDAMSAEVDQLLEASYARSLVFRRELKTIDPEAAAELERDFPIVPRRAARSKAQPPPLSLHPSPAAAWPAPPSTVVGRVSWGLIAMSSSPWLPRTRILLKVDVR